jgi:hypothetical protein
LPTSATSRGRTRTCPKPEKPDRRPCRCRDEVQDNAHLDAGCRRAEASRAGATASPSSAAPFNGGGFPASVADRCSVLACAQARSPLIWFVPARGDDDRQRLRKRSRSISTGIANRLVNSASLCGKVPTWPGLHESCWGSRLSRGLAHLDEMTVRIADVGVPGASLVGDPQELGDEQFARHAAWRRSSSLLDRQTAALNLDGCPDRGSG